MLGLAKKGEHDSTMPKLVATDLAPEGELRMVFKVPANIKTKPRGK